MDIDLPTFSESSDSPAPGKMAVSKKKKSQQPPTICEVCLGKATGHHYDVPSCNGCKSFFRRVTIEKLRYTCKFIDNCFDNLQPGQTVPKCRSCRFKKCVERGMNSLGIQSELKQELERNNSYDLPMIVEKPRQTIEAQVGELIDAMIRLDVQSEKFRDSSYNPHEFPSLKECITSENSMLSIADKYEPMQGWPVSQDIMNEHLRLRKIEKSHHPSVKRWLVYELFIQIEIAKALPFFANLADSDKYCLVRDTVLMSSNLSKSFYSYEQKSDRLLRPDGRKYYDDVLNFDPEHRARLRDDIGIRCLSAILRVGLDRVEMVLLRALVLTNPAISELSEDAKTLLNKERQKYNIALFRYIMAQHGASGPARFATILGFIDILEHQQRDHRDMSLLISLTSPRHCVVPILDEVMGHI